MIPVQFVYLSSLINLCSIAAYIYATLRGKTRPNRVTWAIWTLAPLIGAAAQFSSGVGLSSLIILTTGLGPALVLACSFADKKAYWKIDRADYLCGLLAIAGLIGWQTIGNPSIAILFAIAADFLGGLPTFRKAITDPQSEDGTAYAIAMIGMVIGLLCVQEISFKALAFITYLTGSSIFLCLTVNRRRIRQFLKATA